MGEVRDVDFRGGRSHTPNQHDDRSNGGGPGGTGGGDVLEPRVAKLESDVENIKTNVAEIKTSLGKVVSDVGDIKVSLAEIKARQETFATKEALQEVKTAVQSSANKVILAMFTIAALFFGAMRLFPAPIQSQTQVSGSAAVVESAPSPEVKK